MLSAPLCAAIFWSWLLSAESSINFWAWVSASFLIFSAAFDASSLICWPFSSASFISLSPSVSASALAFTFAWSTELSIVCFTVSCTADFPPPVLSPELFPKNGATIGLLNVPVTLTFTFRTSATLYLIPNAAACAERLSINELTVPPRSDLGISVLTM